MKLTMNLIQPFNPNAVTIIFDKVSAMRIEQRMPIKKNAHFLTDDISIIMYWVSISEKNSVSRVIPSSDDMEASD